MKRILLLLTLILGLAGFRGAISSYYFSEERNGVSLGVNAASNAAGASVMNAAASGTTADEYVGRNAALPLTGRFKESLPLPKGGMIIASRGVNRLGGQRTSRVQSVNSTGHQRANGRSAFFYPFTPQTLKHIFDGRRLETAPFQSAASRYYYVIALRHLII